MDAFDGVGNEFIESLKCIQDLVNKTDLALNAHEAQKKTGSFESLYANLSNVATPENINGLPGGGKPGTVDEMLQAHRIKKQQKAIIDENLEALSQTTKKLLQEQVINGCPVVHETPDESIAPSEDGEEMESTTVPPQINSIPHSIIIPPQQESQMPSAILNAPTTSAAAQPSKGILRSTIFEKMLEARNGGVLGLAQGSIQKPTEEDAVLPPTAKEIIQARLMQHSASAGKLKQVLVPV